MKAITSENTSTYPGVYGSASKVTKHKRDVENEEIQAYLSKLKELVPFMPKNRRLSKLEVIQYVIDYICDLQHALETHPTINSAAVHSAAAVMLSNASQPNSNSQVVSPLHRQPLGVLPPNANLVNVPTQFETSPVSIHLRKFQGWYGNYIGRSFNQIIYLFFPFQRRKCSACLYRTIGECRKTCDDYLKHIINIFSPLRSCVFFFSVKRTHTHTHSRNLIIYG